MKEAYKHHNARCDIIFACILSSLITAGVLGSIFMSQIGKSEGTQIIFKDGSDPDSLVTTIVDQSKDSIVHVKAQGVRVVSTLFGKQSVPFGGTGSGFIISQDGYILTNNHVIEDATNISVILSDSTEAAAQLIGTDPLTDVAVLKIDAKTKPIKLGDSSTVKVGQLSIAIGNPLGLSNSVTTGVISGLDRELTTADQFKLSGIIQTDAAINPGNSGGPLFNSHGEVIGITSAKLSGLLPSGAVPEGVAFAIPINTAKKIADQLISDGRVIRPGLGITAAQLDEQSLLALGVHNQGWGILIVDVLKGGSADIAGLRGTKGTNPSSPGFELGDIITEINGKQTKDLQTLRETLFSLHVGQQVEIKYIRDGKQETTTLVLEESVGSKKS